MKDKAKDTKKKFDKEEEEARKLDFAIEGQEDYYEDKDDWSSFWDYERSRGW